MMLTLRRTCVAAVLAVLVGSVLAQPAPAAGPTMGMDHSSARQVGAEYTSTSGCVQTHVDLFAADILTDTGGFRFERGGQLVITHITGPTGFLHIQQWDCDGNLVLDGFGPPCCDPFPLDGLTIARDLTSASLDTTIPVYDSVSDSTKNIVVDLTWTAIPPLTRGHFGPSDTHCITHNGNQVENIVFNDVGSGYGASVSGSVSDGANSYAPDTLLNAFISEDVAQFLHIGFSDQPCVS